MRSLTHYFPDKKHALSCSGTELTLARSESGPVCTDTMANKTCYGCAGRLAWRNACKRKRNGIAHNVRGHFMHIDNVAASCTNESVFHAAAKHKVSLSPSFQYEMACGQCDEPIAVEVWPDGADVRCEFPWKYGVREYRIDVAFVVDDALVGAVEVMHTHPIDDRKRDDLTRAGVAWVEVAATDVLQNEGEALRAMRCAVVRCQRCDEVAMNIAHENERARKAAVAAAEARAQAKLPKIAQDMERRAWTDAAEQELWQTIYDVSVAKLQPSEQIVHKVVDEVSMVLSGEVRLHLPKHRGEFLSRIWEKDKAYVRWLAGFTGERDGKYPVMCSGNRHPSVRGATRLQHEAAKDLLRGHCYLCFEEVDEDWKKWCRACYHKAQC